MKQTSILDSMLGHCQPPQLLGMMSGEEWNRRLLALPAPSMERDHERLNELEQRMRRAFEINRKAQRDVDINISMYRALGGCFPTYLIRVEGAKKRNTRAYFVASTYQWLGGEYSTAQSIVIATSPKMAERFHRARVAQSGKVKGAKEIIISAYAPGEVEP